MSTSNQNQNQNPELPEPQEMLAESQTPEAPHDENSGAFGFFRKYQKLILYTAVMFALATFSITGSMQQWFEGAFSGRTKVNAFVMVDGKQVALQPEDYQFAQILAQNWRAVTNVLPNLGDTSNSSDLLRRFAALRRISIAEGLDVSMAEVDKALDSLVAMVNTRQQGAKATAANLARMQGMDSLAQYRDLMREAMRIGNYVRMNSLGVDGTDATLMASITDGQEKVALRVAQFDMKALEEELKKKGDVKEEDFRKWLDGKSESERTMWSVYDTNLISMQLGIGRIETFDPAQWTEELKDFKFGDEQLELLYEGEKETRFKLEKPVDGQKWQLMEDQKVKDELTKVAKLDEVLIGIRTKMVTQLQEILKPLLEINAKDAQELALVQQTRGETKLLAEAKPDDAELKLKLQQMDEAIVAKVNADKASRDAAENARKLFDFRGKFAELTKDKAGFEVQELKGPKNADDLKDLTAAPIAMGAWQLPQLATNIQVVGEIGASPARTLRGAFLYQVVELVVRPMKPWDKVKTVVEEKYFIELAKKAGDEKKKMFDDQLLELAKAKIADKVKEIEAKQTDEVTTRFNKWEAETQSNLADADKNLLRFGDAALAAKQAWQATRDRIDTELKGKGAKRTLIEFEVGKGVEAEVKLAAKGKYAEVMVDAANAAGFTVSSVGPIWREASSKVPGFSRQADKLTVYLWSSDGRNLKLGEVTNVLEDAGSRRWLMAACEKVEPLTDNDVPRKEFGMQRHNYRYQGITYAEHQVRTAIAQSFSMDALKERYTFKEDALDDDTTDGKPTDGKPADGKPADGKPTDGKPADGKPADGK